MGSVLTPIDLVIACGSLITVMAIGLWAGRKEENATDYYLAGKNTRWWGVAGSIFGSNISANHMVGMMGVGFSLGFVESHFELGAIAGLLVLCYLFLPVYRKLEVFTLSQYLSDRYNEASRLAYSLIMIILIVAVFMVTAFYIGSRSLNILLLDEEAVHASLQSGQPITIDPSAYVIGILIMAFVTATYTIAGGLKAVIMTDVIQSVLMLVAGTIVAILTFQQPEIGGWAGMRAIDSAAVAPKMHLYLPSDHPDRPWTGMLTGLMVLHFYYWGTNQFIVQRALSARSDREARLGVIAAGFFKLLIPFISIGTGVAAYYLFSQRHPGVQFDGDPAFALLMRQVVAPVGYGLVGFVAAGLVGAILSSLDSMMNSAATLITFDIYKRHVRPDADDRSLIRFGRICIVVLVTTAAGITILVMDPNSKDNFFTYVADHQSRLVAGILVAFAVGMLWKRATPAGGFAAIMSGILFSYIVPPIYQLTARQSAALTNLFGVELSFFHTAFIAACLATLVHFVVSMLTTVDEAKSQLTWTELGGHDPRDIRRLGLLVVTTLTIYALLAGATWCDWLEQTVAGLFASAWTIGIFCFVAWRRIQATESQRTLGTYLREDRIWAGVLAGLAIFMMFHFK